MGLIPGSYHQVLLLSTTELTVSFHILCGFVRVNKKLFCGSDIFSDIWMVLQR